MEFLAQFRVHDFRPDAQRLLVNHGAQVEHAMPAQKCLVLQGFIVGRSALYFSIQLLTQRAQYPAIEEHAVQYACHFSTELLGVGFSLRNRHEG